MSPTGAVPVPATLGEVTPAWLTAALREGGRATASVAGVRQEPIGVGTGFLGHLARLHLTYEGDGAPGPATLVAKLPTTDPGGRSVGLMLNVWARESAFYADLADRCGGHVPACWYNGADPADGRWALVLGDGGPDDGADQVAGADDATARAAVDALVHVQGRWWGRPRPVEWLPGYDRPAYGPLQAAMHQAIPVFTARFGDLVPPRTLGWLARFVDHLPDWAAGQAGGPLTLVHLDYRLDNLVFPAGGDVVILDWQTAIWGPGPLDLASFLATSLTTDDRRRLEDELVERYAAGIGHGVEAGEVRTAYRSALLWWMAIFANNLSRIDTAPGRATQLFHQMVERTFQAADDLDAGELLPSG